MSLRKALAAATLVYLSGCASYGTADRESRDVGNGYIVKLVSIIDPKTDSEIKTDYRGGSGTKDVYADRPVKATLGCVQRAGLSSAPVATLEFLLTLKKGAHMSFAPLVTGGACEILVNIQDQKGGYRIHQFDRVVTGTVEGRDVYDYVRAGSKKP